MKTCLYRHFDKDGNLLYVGISLSPINRLRQHTKSARWVDLISRVEMTWYGTREDAERAERMAIKTELPEYNITHSIKGCGPVPDDVILSPSNAAKFAEVSRGTIGTAIKEGRLKATQEKPYGPWAILSKDLNEWIDESCRKKELQPYLPVEKDTEVSPSEEYLKRLLVDKEFIIRSLEVNIESKDIQVASLEERLEHWKDRLKDTTETSDRWIELLQESLAREEKRSADWSKAYFEISRPPRSFLEWLADTIGFDFKKAQTRVFNIIGHQ